MESVLPEYQLDERLHQSARSIIHRARRLSDNAPCIIKIQKDDHPTALEVERFRREYDTAVSLDVEGVIKPLALSRYKNRMALVMEDFGGVSLSAFAASRALSLDECLAIGVQVAQALGRIHRRHVVHKDIKPSNIVINPDTFQVKLIDFGISTTLSRENPSFRSHNLLEGTLRYISPEQTGRMNRAIDYRTDFYSLGVMLYEILAGAPPFTTEDPVELIHCHIAALPMPLDRRRPDVPQQVADIVMKLLAKTAEDRYQSGQGIAADLERCRAELLASGDVHPFPLGLDDASGRFQIPEKLYGREAEQAALATAIGRIPEGKPELILITGYSGMGKSSLVAEIHKAPPAARSYFISGKFDQLKRNVPYAPFIDAFQDLIRQVLAEREEQLAAWRKRLADALGANADVIAEVIPALELILGRLPKAATLDGAQAQHRFNFAFQCFVRALATPSHPLVIFLDDLQWADASSLHLMRLLMTSQELRHLCIIGAYRDNEIDASHPLPEMVEAIKKAGAHVTALRLEPLGLPDVMALLADTLHCEGERAKPLAALLLQKTEGNPFFLSQLLGALYNEGLIELDAAGRAWRWDLDAIRARAITGGVVDLMAAKIQKLPQAAQEALKVAACIGGRFDLRTLSIALQQPPAETATSFWVALEEGLLLPIDDAYRMAWPARLAVLPDEDAPAAVFRFLHDRVQDAAYSLIPEDQRDDIHADLGRLMLASAPPDKLDERLIDIINQFVLGLGSVESPAERYKVAELSLAAGQKAKAAAAFEAAMRYFRTGIKLLPEGAFSERPELAFALHIHGSEAEYLNANMERAEELALIASEHAGSVLEKAKVAETRMLFSLSRNQLEQTVRIGLAALELLGVSLPFAATQEHLRAALKRNDELLAGRKIEALLLLPEMSDPAHLAAQHILVHLGSPSFVTNPQLFLLVASEQFYLTVLHGVSRYAPIGYVVYGGLHATVLRDVDRAMAFGELAVRVMERLNAREAKAQVYMLNAAMIRSWKVHIRDTFDLLREGMQAGVESGDLQYANRCGSNLCHASVVGGEPLEGLLKTMTRVVEFHTRHKQVFLQLYTSIMRQWAHNLLGRSSDPLALRGECFDEDESLPKLVAAKNYSSTGLFHSLKAMLAYLFGDHAAAVAEAGLAEIDKPALAGLPTSVLANLYQSLALLAVWPDATEEERSLYAAKVERNQAEMGRWAAHAPMNFLHRFQLVEAEKARAFGRIPEAMTLYEKAIRGAVENGYLPEEAIANERCADLCRSFGWERASDAYLADAHYAYMLWGASAKVEELEERFPALFSGKAWSGRRTASHVTTTTSDSVPTERGAVLELRSVLKAAQAISGELVLDQLVQTLLHIMVEYAGAQSGFLLLEKEGKLVIKAEWAPGQTDVIARKDTLFDGGTEQLSSAIVYYAARTGESVVLGNAAMEGRFTKDPYVVKRRPRSVLCAPMFSRGKLVAVIYLENNLTAGAFTADRLEVLQLLSGQAALSIRNATLYATLEQKVSERTRELRDKNEELRRTQKQLVIQEKLASLGALTAGIAHELKNPLNFTINFATLTVQLAQELSEALDSQRSRIEPEVLEEMEEVVGLISQNVEAISSHGERANQIIVGMLQHSRSSSGGWDATDLNALIAESVQLALEGAGHRAALSLSVQLKAEYDPAVGTIDASASDLGRVFLNMIANALYAVAQRKKAEGASGYVPEIRITTRDLGERVEVRIRDNGTGIPEGVIDKIFMPFFTTKPTGEGTGLGLSISYEIIVDAHRGEMTVESAPGELTEFVIKLPRRVRKMDSIPPPSRAGDQ